MWKKYGSILSSSYYGFDSSDKLEYEEVKFLMGNYNQCSEYCSYGIHNWLEKNIHPRSIIMKVNTHK